MNTSEELSFILVVLKMFNLIKLSYKQMQGSKSAKKRIINKNKAEKLRICQSFEKTFEENAEFDAYIESQFQKMIQQKSQNPTLIIPQGFRKFLESKSFKQLLKKIYQYMQALIEFEQKYQHIRKQEGDKILSDPLFRPLRMESNILEEKCKEISYAYMGILLGYGDNKMVFKDQYFFQTMIYFLTQILRGNFQPAQYNVVEEQLNRIFRTDAFNLVKRRHLEDQLLQKYPAIKQNKYDSSVFAVMKLESRLALQKRNHYSMQIKSQRASNGISKPIQINLSTFHSTKRRSPLIASFYPSERQKLFEFSKQVRQKQSFIKTASRRNSFILRRMPVSNKELQ